MCRKVLKAMSKGTILLNVKKCNQFVSDIRKIKMKETVRYREREKPIGTFVASLSKPSAPLLLSGFFLGNLGTFLLHKKTAM